MAALYLVATPIGNLKDITLRALETLAAADVIACEDTRVTRKLLSHYNIHPKRPLIAVHEHNEHTATDSILRRVAAGESVALVSDAGTPLLSDPGAHLLRTARERGIAVVPVVGASAVLAALSLHPRAASGFFFHGFLPARPKDKRTALERVAAMALGVDTTHVFFDSPHRLVNSLRLMDEIVPDAHITVARELTKIYEEARHGTAHDLLEHYGAQKKVRGEIVILLNIPPLAKAAVSDDAIRTELRDLLKTLPVRQAAQQLADKYDRPRRTFYDMALALKKSAASGGGAS